MVYKASIIPGVSKFIDENVLAHYPATSMKRVIMAGAVSLFLKRNEGIVDSLTSNPLFGGLGVVQDNGMVDIDPVRDALKTEIQKVGYMRLSIPMFGDIDFTVDDIDALYKSIVDENTRVVKPTTPTSSPITPLVGSNNNGGVY